MNCSSTIPARLSIALVLFAALLLLPSLSSAEAGHFSVQRSAASSDIDILIDGELFTRFISDDETSNKCYLWPLIGPHETSMTRSFPMADVDGEKKDHPHHRSLFFGLENAGGWNTWHEKATFSKAGKVLQQNRVDRLGRQVCSEVLTAEASADGTSASLVVKIDSLTPEGSVYLEETRRHLFHLDTASGARLIDIESTLSCPAAHDGTTLVGKKDSGLSIRVAHSLSVEAGQGGRIINSRGDQNAKAWGKRVPWVDFNGPINGRIVGIAMLNHPDSFRHPTPWHVRSYGLFTANPFALREVAREKESGDYQLGPETSITLKHRIILHEGDETEARIASAWERYAKE